MKRIIVLLIVLLLVTGCTLPYEETTQPQLTGEDFVLSLVNSAEKRISRGYGDYAGHEGVDIAAPEGAEIYAADSGVVIQTVEMNMGYGIHCVIQHESYNTLYAHCSSLNVEKGDIVRKGDVIGYVGNTGNSTGPHLHFEVIVDDEPCDPVQWYK